MIRCNSEGHKILDQYHQDNWKRKYDFWFRGIWNKLGIRLVTRKTFKNMHFDCIDGAMLHSKKATESELNNEFQKILNREIREARAKAWLDCAKALRVPEYYQHYCQGIADSIRQGKL
jgi:hypothetical protein